jgi:hypothetical protein
MMDFDDTVIAVNFNDTYAAYQRWQPDELANSYPATRIWHHVYGTTRANLANAVNLSKQRNAGWIYMTDDVDPNPWNTLPNDAYWGDELQLAENGGNEKRIIPLPGNIVRVSPKNCCAKQFRKSGYGLYSKQG